MSREMAGDLLLRQPEPEENRREGEEEGGICQKNDSQLFLGVFGDPLVVPVIHALHFSTSDAHHT